MINEELLYLRGVRTVFYGSGVIEEFLPSWGGWAQGEDSVGAGAE